jgi:hypothetical protein
MPVEPLEPDAGNAAEGSEVKPCDFPRMAFFIYFMTADYTDEYG